MGMIRSRTNRFRPVRETAAKRRPDEERQHGQNARKQRAARRAAGSRTRPREPAPDQPDQLRSKAWFDNPANADMTALYIRSAR